MRAAIDNAQNRLGAYILHAVFKRPYPEQRITQIAWYQEPVDADWQPLEQPLLTYDGQERSPRQTLSEAWSEKPASPIMQANSWYARQPKPTIYAPGEEPAHMRSVFSRSREDQKRYAAQQAAASQHGSSIHGNDPPTDDAAIHAALQAKAMRRAAMYEHAQGVGSLVGQFLGGTLKVVFAVLAAVVPILIRAMLQVTRGLSRH